MEQLSQNDYTKHYIVEALFKLMQTKPFSEISVTELVKKAGVGRATFYRAFASKEEVIAYYFNKGKDRFAADIRFIPRSDADYYDVIKTVFSVLRDNREFFERIRQSRLEQLYLDYLNRNFAERFIRTGDEENPFLPYAYAGALYNVSMRWVETGFAEPLEAVVKAMFIATLGKDKYDELMRHR